MSVPSRKDKPLPDLIPFKYRKNFCHTDEQCRLIITVENRGAAAAPPSTTRVEFEEGRCVDIPTPVIPPFSRVDLDPVEISFPESGVALFTIIVNARHEIRESNLENNAADGLCSKSTDCRIRTSEA